MTDISILLSGKEDDFRHLSRAIRENAAIHRRNLDETGEADRASVGCLIGNVEALRVVGIHIGVDVSDLARWLWLKLPWESAKREGLMKHAV